MHDLAPAAEVTIWCAVTYAQKINLPARVTAILCGSVPVFMRRPSTTIIWIIQQGKTIALPSKSLRRICGDGFVSVIYRISPSPCWTDAEMFASGSLAVFEET
jgi:hypothetical protein